MTHFVNPDRRVVALMVLRARLGLELRVPHFATGSNARFTLKAVKGWGFKGKTRKDALAWVEEQLRQVPVQV